MTPPPDARRPAREPEAPRLTDEMFRRHLPDLEAYVRWRTDPVLAVRESTSDLVQSVCREVLQHAHRFQHDGDVNFRRWLFRTARRKIIDRHRYHTAHRRAPSREDDAPWTWPSSSPTPSQDAVAREQLQRLEAALARLPRDYRDVIVLSRLERLTHAEIARRMGRTEGATRNLLYRGLVALSALLDEPGG